MRVLVLGGSEFVGRAVVEEALIRGAEVTVFNRGTREAPAGTRGLTGDRSIGELTALAVGEWDVVVDTWSRAPFAVRDAADRLAGRVGRYVYVSSRSVYAYPPAKGLTEAGPVVEGDPGANGNVEYAEAKRGGELAAVNAFGERALLLRAGLILGPHENIGRLPWWLRRIAKGGPVAAPGPRDLELQYIDARDLAGFALDAADRGLGGAYDLVSPPGTTMGELLDICVDLVGSDARLHWVTPEMIERAGVEPWTELPIWLPPGPEHDGMHGSDVSKALAAGLTLRPTADTVADTWAWLTTMTSEPTSRPPRATIGLSPEKEALLLQQV